MEFRDAVSGLERIFLRRHVVRLHLPGCPVRNCGFERRIFFPIFLCRSTKLFGPNGKRSEHLSFLNLAQNVLCLAWSFIIILVGVRVYGINYSFPEYVLTFLVAGGVSSFALLKTSSKTIKKLAHPNAPLGYGLCFLNLAFDGFTNAIS
ncbi:hypothetical protein ZIOFF_005378 [Zingiber officinale]|uniref:Uncharacterized protein n=1 Tax=Zingiber officinale TaxID=94328 RepID=A0A8J5HVF3_ZINOF|nr:hypothetical protein ZIOFF_005378 [Zingiber officinale]